MIVPYSVPIRKFSFNFSVDAGESLTEAFDEGGDVVD